MKFKKIHTGKFKLFIVMMFLPCCVFQKPSWQMGPFKLKFKKTPILSISTTRCVRFQSRVTARVVHKEECLYSSPFFSPYGFHLTFYNVQHQLHLSKPSLLIKRGSVLHNTCLQKEIRVCVFLALAICIFYRPSPNKIECC